MMKLKKIEKWRTGIYESDINNFVSEKSPFRGRGYKIAIRVFSKKISYRKKDRNKQFDAWQAKITERYDIRSFYQHNGAVQTNPELIIETKKMDTAFKVANFLPCAITLYWGELFDIEQENTKYGWRLEYPYIQNIDGKLYRQSTVFGAVFAAQIAAKASLKKSWKNAVIRYWGSHKICSSPWYAVSPRAASAYSNTYDEVYHGLFAQSIVSAYGAIEELELRILPKKVGKKGRPDFKDMDGKYLTSVIDDIEKRLRTVGLSTSDNVMWISRKRTRKRSKINATNAHVVFREGEWVYKFIPLIDALYIASKLRSAISAHKYNKDTHDLTHFEVFNVQNLARVLILFSMKLSRHVNFGDQFHKKQA